MARKTTANLPKGSSLKLRLNSKRDYLALTFSVLIALAVLFVPYELAENATDSYRPHDNQSDSAFVGGEVGLTTCEDYIDNFTKPLSGKYWSEVAIAGTKITSLSGEIYAADMSQTNARTRVLLSSEIPLDGDFEAEVEVTKFYTAAPARNFGYAEFVFTDDNDTWVSIAFQENAKNQYGLSAMIWENGVRKESATISFGNFNINAANPTLHIKRLENVYYLAYSLDGTNRIEVLDYELANIDEGHVMFGFNGSNTSVRGLASYDGFELNCL